MRLRSALLAPGLMMGTVLLTLMACTHSDPLAGGPFSPGVPRSDTLPHQVTFNLGLDVTPAWLPDGSGILYSFARTDQSDKDHCIGRLPPDGGTRLQTICDLNSAGGDSTNSYEAPIADAAGRLAFIRVASARGATIPTHREIVTTTVSSPAAMISVRSFPYPSPSGALPHDGGSFLRWLGPTGLIYIGSLIGYQPACPGCTALDTVVTGLEIARLDITTPSPVPTIVPGTGFASSLDVEPDGSAIYYTLGGDSRVYRQVLASGATTMIHDFGAAGIARDVSVRGSKLAAVVGGSVSFGFDNAFNTSVQRDQGGALYTVDLTSGQETQIPFTGFRLRRPALSPNGQRIVVEAYDTLTTAEPDLFLIGAP